MKKLFFSSVLIFLVSSVLHAQQNSKPPLYNDVIIQVPEITIEKNLQSVISAVTDVTGVKYEGFCNSVKCIMLQVDRNLQPVNVKLEAAIKNLGVNFSIKEDASIKQVKANCKDVKEKNNVKTEPKSVKKTK